MKSLSVFVRAIRSPIEGVVVIISLGLLAYAIYLFSPWYVGGYSNSIFSAVDLQRAIEQILAFFFGLSAVPGLMIPFVRKKLRTKYLGLATFGIFLSFLFLTILRIAFFGLVPWSWLPLLMLCLIGGYLNLWLKVRKE